MRKLSLFVLGLILITGINSCKKQARKKMDPEAEKEITLAVKSGVLTDDAMDLVENMFDPNSARSSGNHHQLPSCVTVSRYMHGDTLAVTWEFDPNGCQMPNGRTYTGTIHILRIFDHQNHNFRLDVNFDGVTIDSIAVDGSFSRTHVWQNANGHPESTATFDITVTWPNGDTATRQGTRTIEWIEGYDTHQHDDDVWLITGNWHITRRNGNQIDMTVTTPLRREFTCPYIVSGVLDITYNGDHYTLDFGNGTCDDEAVLTDDNGNSTVIHLN